ncbi:MAG: OadG family protein [Fusobacteriaceae bacterium]
MNITQILEIFSDKEMIQTLSFSEKMLGVAVTVILGMGLTFLVLIVLQYLIGVLTSFMIAKPSDKNKQTNNASEDKKVTKEIVNEQDDDIIEDSIVDNTEELVAAITAALTLKLGRENRFIVKDIVRVADNTPVWNRTGLLEQMTSRF